MTPVQEVVKQSPLADRGWASFVSRLWRTHRGLYVHGQKATVIMIRWTMLMVLFYFILYARKTGDPSHLTVLLTLLVVYGLSNVVLMKIPQYLYQHRTFNYALVGADSILLGVFIALSEKSWDYKFLFVDFLIIFMVLTGFSLKKSMVAGFVLSLVYLGLSSRGSLQTVVYDTDLLIHVPFILILTLFYSYFSEETRMLRRREAEERRLNVALNRELNFIRTQLTEGRAQSALSEGLRGMAHSVNNALTVILGEALSLGERDRSGETQRSVQTITEQGKHCHDLVQEAVAAVRTAGPRMEPLDLNALLLQVLGSFSGALDVSRVRVQTRLTQDLPRVRGNASHLEQVFINLINNARQAMADHEGRGELEVRTWTETGEDGRLRVITAVRDSGPGIPEGLRDRIFEPYFSTKDQSDGMGLGLSICREVVETHGGEIHLDPPAAGAGAEFIVALPAIPEDNKTRRDP